MKTIVSFAGILLISSLTCNLCAQVGEPQPAAQLERQEAGSALAEKPGTEDSSQFVIPGPQRSFMRMAGISQKVTREEVLPLLSRNVYSQGYIGRNRPTEFLILLRRYVVQARELASLAEHTGMVLRVSNCTDAGPLLRILGYRVRGNCGEADALLQTADPERAFLAIDSGFPLPALEQTLQGGKPFEYSYPSEAVPVVFAEGDWTELGVKNFPENSRDLLDTILFDEPVARLYWAVSRMDAETSLALKQSVGLRRLLPYAATLDFYGRELCINNGHVGVPGGQRAISAWKEVVGANPASPASFVPRLLSRDRGWLAAYFDVLSRASAKQQEYFTDPRRLRAFYNAFRTPEPAASATRGSFRPAPWLLLLVTRVQLDDAGEPLVPGNLEVWSDIVFHGYGSGFARKWAKHTEGFKDPNQLMKVLLAFSRSSDEVTPLQEYLAISELDSRRDANHRLTPATVRLLARRFHDFSDQYRIFTEFPELNDQSITLFMQVAQGMYGIPMSDRGNAFGIFQANVGLWQILARQRQIPNQDLNESWQRIIKPFAAVRSSSQVYDAGRTALAELFRCSTGNPRVSQDKLIELLAGPAQSSSAGKQMHREIAARLRSVLDDQRLVSLDTLMTIGDALREKTRGTRPEDYVMLLAGETREFEMPRPIFTMGERDEWAEGIYNNHHTDLEMKTDLARVLQSTTLTLRQIEQARGQLASFLRDTLVGLNYAYYEPPGAQDLHNNPLLVRSHDFSGESVSGVNGLWQAPEIFGQGLPAGGGAHFVGSLVDLPYSLAILEEDFISPNNVQALIVRDVAAEMLASAVLPRWWSVSRSELHAIALSQRAGEELLTASIRDEELRGKILALLSERLLPHRLKQVERALRSGQVSELLPGMMPADTFYLGMQFCEKYPDWPIPVGTAALELRELAHQHPDQVNWSRLSRDFGTPHPITAQNYGLEILNMPLMPPLAGGPNRFLGESWDSVNLYWARLADERGYEPVMMNHLVPQLTRMMIERIFASDFEDWPALLRAMHETARDFHADAAVSHEAMSSGHE